MTEIDWKTRALDAKFEVYNFIDGKRHPVGGKARIEKCSPRDGTLLYEFGEGERSDAEAAIASAKRAFDDRRWRGKSFGERAAALNKLADLIEANTEELALNESMDVGKSITSALNLDIPSVIGGIREAAAGAGKIASPSGFDGNVYSYQIRQPLGVVAAITGWNFPLLMACGVLAPALAMGNSIVIKPSEFTSLSTWRLGELALEAGIPAGVVNVVNGRGTIVGDALARSMDVRMLSFVGSSATGKRLMVAAGESNMKRLNLECGGKSPYLIFDDYAHDLDALVNDLVCEHAFRNQGAVCVSATRILMQEGIRDAVVEKILAKTKEIIPADPLDPSTVCGAIMNEAHLKKVLAYIEIGKSEGADLLYGGEQVRKESGGYYLTPAVFDNVRPDARIAKEEIFGPVMSLFTFKTEEEAIALANDSEFGLAAYAATGDSTRLHRLGRELEAGSVELFSNSVVSGYHFFGTEPHKQSGMGPYGGEDGLRAYTTMSHVWHMY